MTQHNQNTDKDINSFMNKRAGKPHYVYFGTGTHKRLMTIDPLSHYQGVKVGDLLEALGLLPIWLSEINDSENIMEEMRKKYQYGAFDMGGEVTQAGLYRYPEDPDLYPIATVNIKNKTALFYQYGMFSVLDNDTGEAVTVRMD